MVTTGSVCSITLLRMADKEVARPAFSTERLEKMGRALLLARKRADLDQSEVAERTGIDPKTISRLENGRHPPQLATLDALAGVYKCTIDELMGRDIVITHSDGSVSVIEVKQSTEAAIKPDLVFDGMQQPDDVAGTSFAPINISAEILAVVTKRIDDLRDELKANLQLSWLKVSAVRNSSHATCKSLKPLGVCAASQLKKTQRISRKRDDVVLRFGLRWGFFRHGTSFRIWRVVR